MKNMPSVMKEMPDGAPQPAAGKKMQKRSQMASGHGPDFPSSAMAPITPPAFHRLFQDSLRDRDQAGDISASLSIDGRDGKSAAGNAQLPPSDGETGLLRLASTKGTLGKGRLKLTGVKGKTGKTISMEQSLNGNPKPAVSSPHISMTDNNGDHALQPSEEIGENHVRLQTSSGKTHDHLRSVLRHTGEQSAVRGEAGPGEKTAIDETGGNAKRAQVGDVDDAAGRLQSVDPMYAQDKHGSSDDSLLLSAFGEASGKRPRTAASPLLNGSAATVNAAPLTSGAENGSDVLSGRRLQHASVTMHDHLRSGDRYADENSSFPEGKGGSISDAAIGEMAGDTKTAFPEDTGDVTGSVHGAETRHGNGGTGRADDSSLLPLLKKEAGRSVQMPGEHSSLRSAAAAASSLEPPLMSIGSDGETGILPSGLLQNVSEKMHDHTRSVRRHTSAYSVIPGEKEGAGKNAGILEMEGNVTAVQSDDIDDGARGVRGTENGHYEELKGRPDGSPLFSMPKENSGGHLRQAFVGDKPSFFAAASMVPSVDMASISVGPDNGEGVLSPGRQALLMAEVIDSARPLVQEGGGRIRISLSPPSLGDLDIDVRVRKGGVELFVVANNSDVQQTLCSHVDQLRKALVEQGLNMDRFQVIVGDRSDGQQGHGPRQEGMSGGHREAWSEQGHLPGLDGDNVNDEMGNSALSGPYRSDGVINLFI